MDLELGIDAVVKPWIAYHDLGRLLLVLQGIFLLAAGQGCARENTSKAIMPKRLAHAIEEARSGKTFMESSLSNEALSSEEVEAARNFVSGHPDASAYILLMALREHAPETYAHLSDETKAKVLCDALVKLTFLNDFGHLDPSASFDGQAAKALLAVGEHSLSCLRVVMNNRQEAPLFGSEEATISNMYKYRRSDFAYRYVMLILGRKPAFSTDPTARDRLITELQKELNSM